MAVACASGFPIDEIGSDELTFPLTVGSLELTALISSVSQALLLDEDVTGPQSKEQREWAPGRYVRCLFSCWKCCSQLV